MVRFVSPGDFATLLDHASHDVAAYKASRGADMKSKWEEWADWRLPSMMREREQTAQFLASPETALRLAAASLVAEYWPSCERFVPDALRLAFHDPQSSVRGAALLALMRLQRFVDDSTGVLPRLIVALFGGGEANVSIERSSVRSRRENLRAGMRETWEKLGGSSAAIMLRSRVAAESYLTHAEPDVRRCAILILKHHWSYDEAFIERCERIVCEDPSPEVRALAMSAIAGHYIRSDNRRIGKLAADLVFDPESPLRLRIAAYRALHTIRGMPLDQFLRAASTSFQFPDDVDWEFVRTFCQSENAQRE